MKNFTKTIGTIFLLTLTFNIYSQSYGLKAGFNFSNIELTSNLGKFNTKPKFKPGFMIGVYGEYGINSIFSFSPEILLNRKGFNSSESEENYKSENFVNLYYLEIPINLKGKFNVGHNKMYISMGPSFALGLSGSAHHETTISNETTTEDKDISFGSEPSNLKSYDISLNFGFGYEYKSIIIGFNYGYGLTNMFNNESDDFISISGKNRTVSLNVAYTFNSKKSTVSQ